MASGPISHSGTRGGIHGGWPGRVLLQAVPGEHEEHWRVTFFLWHGNVKLLEQFSSVDSSPHNKGKQVRRLAIRRSQQREIGLLLLSDSWFVCIEFGLFSSLCQMVQVQRQ
uniref:Uncharacterized protein n=1 Tax=Opuntia streptacantha TaxID=393608 RepID=A0A7C9ASR2_OPUST